MDIVCPLPGTNVAVSGTNTICVRGTVSGAQGEQAGLPVLIRVRVVAGHIVPPPPEPEPRLPVDVDVRPTGAEWYAPDVPVPGSNPTGEPLTVIAWERIGRGNWGQPQSAQFFGGGPNPVDCCN